MLSSLTCFPLVFKLITRTMLTGADLHVIQGHPTPPKKIQKHSIDLLYAFTL